MNKFIVRGAKICNKLIGRGFANTIYRIIGLFNGGHKANAVADPEAFLESIHKDAHSSSICRNEVTGPKVDLQIIVPIYKTEKFLDKCLQSILSQETTYTFKVIAVNDGSPDKCCEILKKYESDERVTVITQENKGVLRCKKYRIITYLRQICGILRLRRHTGAGCYTGMA